MKKQNLTATLPATRVTEEMRNRVQTVAEALDCDMADVVRDALATLLVHAELQTGISTLDDYEDEELIAVGLQQAVQERELARRAREALPPVKEDRTRGLAWGPPAEPEKPKNPMADF